MSADSFRPKAPVSDNKSAGLSSECDRGVTDGKQKERSSGTVLTEESLLTLNFFCLINIKDVKPFGIFLGSYWKTVDRGGLIISVHFVTYQQPGPGCKNQILFISLIIRFKTATSTYYRHLFTEIRTFFK